jgi:hypothetical protein
VNGSAEQKCGTIKNLSGDGISFYIDQAVTEGTEVHISITPENTVTPPLNVTVEVLRCSQADDNQYEIAGNITRR